MQTTREIRNLTEQNSSSIVSISISAFSVLFIVNTTRFGLNIVDNFTINSPCSSMITFIVSESLQICMRIN